jgi:hypothetical protein
MAATLGLTAATAVSNVTVTPTSTSVGATAVTYKITFTATRAVPANINDPSNAGAITISAPFGTQFVNSSNGDYGVDDSTTGVSTVGVNDSLRFADGGAIVSFNPLDTINAGDSVILEISAVRNAQSTGGSLSVSTSGDPLPMAATLGLAAATAVTNVTVTPTSTSVGATAVTYKITFTAASKVPANINDPSNAGAITISAPFGTQFGDDSNNDYGVDDTTTGMSTVGVNDSLRFADGGAVVSFNPLDTINAGDSVTLEISGIGRVAAGPIAVSTTADPLPASLGTLSLPTAPSHVKAVNAGNNAATVTWSPATSSGAPIESYIVSVASGKNTGEQLAVPGTTTAATLTGLVAGKTTFDVQAFDVIGAGPSASSASYTVKGATTPTYVTTVLGNHPSLFYRLGDSASVAMADSSGNATTGYYNDAGTALYGYPNDNLNVRPGALLSDPNAPAVTDEGNGATSGGVGIGGQYVPSGSSPRTAEVWINDSQTGFNPDCLVAWGSSGKDDAFEVCVSASNQIEVSGAYDDHYFTTPYAVNDGHWHLVTVTSNGSSIALYLDGVSIGSGSFTAPLDTTAGYPVVVGDSVFHQNPATGFSLDDVAIYPTVLSATQIQADYTAAGYP